MNTQPNLFEQAYQQADKEKKSYFSELIEPEPETSEEKVNLFEDAYRKKDEKKAREFSFLETLQDVGEQVVSKGISGFAGGYGNALDAFGLQLKEGETLPGEQARRDIEFDILEKMNKGEERPSFADLYMLSDEDYPSITRLPTSTEVKKGIEKTTGIGEGKTPVGRIAGRGSEFLGEGVAFGGGAKGLTAQGLSGMAGQTIREVGGPEALATGTEIAGTIVPSLVQGKLKPTGTEAKRVTDAGRALGLTEKQITPLIQGERKAATLAKIADKAPRYKKLFSSIKEKLGDSYTNLKKSPEAKKALSNADQIDLRKQFGDIRNELSKTLAPSPDRKAALDFIENALDTLRNQNITPEHLINFWQDINKSVKWNSIQGGKKALAQLKDPISKVFERTAPGIAKDFEITNMLYSKYAQISKKLKPDLVDSFLTKGEALAIAPAGMALVYGNPNLLAGLAGEKALRILASEMLTNPYFQNLGTKLVTNFNQGSVKGVTELVKQGKEYMERKHPNEKWDFLLNQ